MGARFRSLWQNARKPLEIFVIFVGCIFVIALLVVIVLAYIFNVNVPGLSGKTLWDWLQLLIIPLVLATVALLFNRATTRTDQRIAAQRYEQDQKITLDKQREDLFQTYLDSMSELLLGKNLRSSQSDAEVRNVARVRTLTVLCQLDVKRINYVFSFLREAGLISIKPNESIISFNQADLTNINFSNVKLNKTDLSKANLESANLSGADLFGANLSGAYLTKVNLSEANLDTAILSEADLTSADLSKADLTSADLTNTKLLNANLQEANLYGAILNKASLFNANLCGAYLCGASFTEAYLNNADLSRADLSGTKITDEQLAKAKSLKGAIMPGGTIHP